MKMSSTLVETVSINYEDFNESFLTCGTCLCKYMIYVRLSIISYFRLYNSSMAVFHIFYKEVFRSLIITKVSIFLGI